MNTPDIPGQGCVPPGATYPSDCELTEMMRQRSIAPATLVPRPDSWQRCFPRARLVKLLLLDVDGVMTSGVITYTDNNEEVKSFHSRDGFGIRLLREAGIRTGIITARTSQALLRRVQDLKLELVFQGVEKKVALFEKILPDLGLKPAEVAYMGDDWLDLQLLSRVGLAATVADAPDEVRNQAHFIASRTGGHGAVRELCELLLESRGLLAGLFQQYS